MWCIDAVPLSRRQVNASFYDLLHPAVHRNLGLIPSLLPDVRLLIGMLHCILLHASITQRPLPGGQRMKDLKSYGRQRESRFQYFLWGAEKESVKLQLRYSVFWDVKYRRLPVINERFGSVYRSIFRGWSNERLQIVRVDIRNLDVTNTEQQCSVLCLF
jgi:hypothetical protein